MAKIPSTYFNVYDSGWFAQGDIFAPSSNALAQVHLWFDDNGQPHVELVTDNPGSEPATPAQTCC